MQDLLSNLQKVVQICGSNSQWLLLACPWAICAQLANADTDRRGTLATTTIAGRNFSEMDRAKSNFGSSADGLGGKGPLQLSDDSHLVFSGHIRI